MSIQALCGLSLLIASILPVFLIGIAIPPLRDRKASVLSKIGGWALMAAGVSWAIIDGLIANLFWAYSPQYLVMTLFAVGGFMVFAGVLYRLIHRSWSLPQAEVRHEKALHI